MYGNLLSCLLGGFCLEFVVRMDCPMRWNPTLKPAYRFIGEISNRVTYRKHRRFAFRNSDCLMFAIERTRLSAGSRLTVDKRDTFR